MPYEIHAYCTSAKPSTIREILTWLRDEDLGWGSEAEAPETGAEALDSEQWSEFELRYARNGRKMESLVLGCYRNTGPESMCAGMAQGRLQTVSGYKDSPGKRHVMDCLSSTQFVIWCRVDNDPERDRASLVLDLLASILEKHGAVLDLEDEGFLADSDTPLCGWCAHDE